MRHALSLHGDDEKVEAGDDLLGVDQAVDAPPVAPWRLSGRGSKFTLWLLPELSLSISLLTPSMQTSFTKSP